MEIVPMTSTHVSQAAALEALCFSAPWSEKSLREELDNPLALWLVAVEGGELVGYIGSQTVLGETDMMNLAVAPACRRRGIARGLVLALMDTLREQGSHSLTLEVRRSNSPARALYESLGFAQVGLRKNYYQRPREDGVILRKEWEI